MAFYNNAPPSLFMAVGQLPSGDFEYVYARKREAAILLLKEQFPAASHNIHVFEYKYSGFNWIENE